MEFNTEQDYLDYIKNQIKTNSGGRATDAEIERLAQDELEKAKANGTVTFKDGTSTGSNTDSTSEYNSKNSTAYGVQMGDLNNAVDSYLDSAKAINKEYLNNISKYESTYGESVSDYAQKLQDARDNYNKAMNTATAKYENAAKQYTGDTGYQNSLQAAQEGATQSAANAAATAQGAARSAGMSKAASAAMGAGSAINAYTNGLANQQSQASNMYNQALNAAGNAYAQDTAQAATGLNSETSGANNVLGANGTIYNTGVNTAGTYATNMNNAYQQNVTNKYNDAALTQAGKSGLESVFDKTTTNSDQAPVTETYSSDEDSTVSPTKAEDNSVSGYATGGIVGQPVKYDASSIRDLLSKCDDTISRKNRKFSDLIINR